MIILYFICLPHYNKQIFKASFGTTWLFICRINYILLIVLCQIHIGIWILFGLCYFFVAVTMQNFRNIDKCFFYVYSFFCTDFIKFLDFMLLFQILQRKVLYLPLYFFIDFVANYKNFRVCFIIIFSLYDPVLL
jgi:hypothetical protein